MKTSFLAGGLSLVVTLGCNGGALTREEASQALEETQSASQAMRLTSGSIEQSSGEITTSFQIGDAVEEAAQALRDFYESQLPCATVTLEDRTLTIEYGQKGTCEFNGQTYSGTHAIKLASIKSGEAVVEHTWDELSNQSVEVSGEATVTWNIDEPSRRVEHELTWTRLSDEQTFVGMGDRTQTPLDGGLSVGFGVDGTRAWEADSGHWDLSINEVEMRWVDPVPQAGSYSLNTPFDKQLSVGFERLDEDTITVTVSSGARSFDFDVTSAPTD